MASFKATFTSDDQFSAGLQESGSLKADFGDTKTIGTGDYNDLTNKPLVEGHTLVGDKSFKQLGMDTLSQWEIEKILYLD